MPISEMHQPHVDDKRGMRMEILIFLGIMAFMVILQVWILPRLGVKT